MQVQSKKGEMIDPKTCEHKNFHSTTKVHRSDIEGRLSFSATVSIFCKDCKTDFAFRLPQNMTSNQPGRNPDGSLFCPIDPVGEGAEIAVFEPPMIKPPVKPEAP